MAISVLSMPAVVPERPSVAGPGRASLILAAVLGAVATAAVMTGFGHAPVSDAVRLGTGFGGLLRPNLSDATVADVAVLLGLATLVGCWWWLVQHACRQQVSARAVLAVAAAWTLPVLVGPALLSMDAYAYLAQGSMLVHGLDPYSGGPVLLGADPVALRVDTLWRSSPVPYGPVALVLLRSVAALSTDTTLGVLLLRLLALSGVVVAAATALRLTAAEHRARTLALTVANPLVVVQLIGGVHLDAVVAGGIGLTLVALATGRHRRAVLLAATVTAIKITTGPLLLFVLLAFWRSRSGRPRGARALAEAVALVAAPYLLTLPLVPRPWAFVSALGVSGTARPDYTASALLADGLRLGARLVGQHVGLTASLHVGRFLALAVGAGLVLLLLVRTARESGPGGAEALVRRAAVATAAAQLCLPTLYGWYLAGVLFGLAAVGGRWSRRTVVVLSGLLSFVSLPQLFRADQHVLHYAWLGVAVLLLATVAVLSGRAGRPSTGTALVGRARPSSPGWPPLGRRAAAVGAAAVVVTVVAGSVVSLPAGEADAAVQQARAVAATESILAEFPRYQLYLLTPVAGRPGYFEAVLNRGGRPASCARAILWHLGTSTVIDGPVTPPAVLPDARLGCPDLLPAPAVAAS